MKSTGNKYLTF